MATATDAISLQQVDALQSASSRHCAQTQELTDRFHYCEPAGAATQMGGETGAGGACVTATVAEAAMVILVFIYFFSR